MSDPYVEIIILNWCGLADTKSCLNSVFAQSYSNFGVTVVDNCSPDGSFQALTEWAETACSPVGNANSTENDLLAAALAADAPSGFSVHDQAVHGAESAVPCNPRWLNLIKAEQNLGFGAGNNIGMKAAIDKFDADMASGDRYIWILNNDTVVEKKCLSALVTCATSMKEREERVGIVCSKVKYLAQPNIFQGIGGAFNKWTFRSSHFGGLEPDIGQYDDEGWRDHIDYPIGAAMFVSEAFVREVGMICEDHFLYYEELDWMARAKSTSFKLGYAWQAVIYHKEAASTGATHSIKNKSRFSDYCFLRSRVRYGKKNGPVFLAVAVFVTFLSIISRITSGRFDLASLGLFASLDGISTSKRPFFKSLR